MLDSNTRVNSLRSSSVRSVNWRSATFSTQPPFSRLWLRFHYRVSVISMCQTSSKRRTDGRTDGQTPGIEFCAF